MKMRTWMVVVAAWVALSGAASAEPDSKRMERAKDRKPRAAVSRKRR